MKKGIVKLYPTMDKSKVGSYVKFGNDITKVVSIDSLFINGDIPINKTRTLKYYVTNNRGIIGELEYADYDKVEIDQEIEYSSRTILNKMQIGDEITIFKANCQCILALKYNLPISGTIVEINGRYATVDIHGTDDQILCKRHFFKLDKGNIKTICKYESEVSKS